MKPPGDHFSGKKIDTFYLQATKLCLDILTGILSNHLYALKMMCFNICKQQLFILTSFELICYYNVA